MFAVITSCFNCHIFENIMKSVTFKKGLLLDTLSKYKNSRENHTTREKILMTKQPQRLMISKSIKKDRTEAKA